MLVAPETVCIANGSIVGMNVDGLPLIAEAYVGLLYCALVIPKSSLLER